MDLAAKFWRRRWRRAWRSRARLSRRPWADPATQVTLRLGYASNERFALKEHLGDLGVSVDDMIEAGLLASVIDPDPYNRFRDCVIFPISDLRGHVIAFGGRALEKDVPAKYLNSPETPLFHKGATLYNIAAARVAAHKGAPVVAVEGYVDVIAMVNAGYEAAVAPLGTALTSDQLELMWKMADEPILCFDGDSAGRRASYRAVDVALPLIKPGKSLKFASLPEGQDPDDLWRSGGRDAIGEVIGGSRPLAQVLWTRETEAGGFDTPERRAALEARVAEVTSVIGNDTVRKYYRQEFEERLRRMFEGERRPDRREPAPQRWRGTPPARRGGRFDRGRPAPAALGGGAYAVASPQLAASAILRGHRAAIPRREALILQAVVNHPWLAQDHLEELADLEFRHVDTQKLKGALLDILAHNAEMVRDDLNSALARTGHGDELARVSKTITTVSVWGAQPDAAPADVLMTWRQLIALHRQWHSLIKELKDAELALGQDFDRRQLLLVA